MTRNKLLILCGPTASGKTALALTLARSFDGALISADSRQVYKGMDIVTGKDLPKGKRTIVRRLGVPFEKRTYDLVAYDMGGGIPIWLYDVVAPNEEFSVAHFVTMARAVMEDIWKRNKLPIIVGGTALYVRLLLAPPETLGVPRDERIRARFADASVFLLQEELEAHAPGVLSLMNASDRKNPRRLIRKIEVARVAQKKREGRKKDKISVLTIGITRNAQDIRRRIHKRVLERAHEGALDETAAMRTSGYSWELPAFTGVGYRQLRPVLEGETSLEAALRAWEVAELSYVRSQMLFFRKIPHISWYDMSVAGTASKIEHRAVKWYTR